ncbi:PSP1 domain protein [Thermotoga petrophila RKU-10]|uniref:PSP1 domain protein n=1 Tax=Thermotoga petrophila (strain ATCC BAA-489 / DSM 13996 / JCM 10882 / RKU-10) TaxID=590168 RepID=D2C6T0_THEP2|nr:stage 0 sporulation family protein [Thermotoga petrophila]ADA66666.1 PSP1 domain protein [Thermotoga petrophila RKU-10]
MELKARAVGVEIIPKGKIIYYSVPNGDEYERGDLVLVLGDFGLEVGKVLIPPREVVIDEVGYELKAVIRKLTDEDLEQYRKNVEDAWNAFQICRQKIKEHGLPMKLLYAKYTFDRTRLIFFFSAEGRVDFRELVRDLAKIFKTRIELRQVGVRDEMKFFGGLGLCGLPTCCSTFLREFTSVTLKHAKKQQMMINPAKISGPCRRLLCCLTYEYDFYEKELEGIPDEGSTITYEGKRYKVVNVNVFLRTVTLFSEQEGEMIKVPFDYFRKGE